MYPTFSSYNRVIALVVMMLIVTISPGRDIYVSSSQGNDAYDGLTSATPWQSFANFSVYTPLQPGDRVFLKSGDIWTDELELRGEGTASSPITLTSYDSGNQPRIVRSDKTYHKCITWNNPSYVNISNMDCRTAKVGIHLRYEYTDINNYNVSIDNCYFEDMDSDELEPALHNYEFAWSDAITLSGQCWHQAETATFLTNLTITNCVAVRCAHLFGSGFYYPPDYKSRIKNLVIEDCLALNCLMGSVSLIGIDGGYMRRVHALGGGGVDTWCGSTLGMIQDSKNFTIDDCEFAYLDRYQSGDGSGFDFEGNTDGCVMTRCTIHNNDAPGILILCTGGAHTNLTITDNVFYNNARNPWNNEANSEMVATSHCHATGTISNNGVYRGNNTIDKSLEFLTSTSDWTGFYIAGNRYLEYSSVEDRPQWWDWNSYQDLEGWSTFNQWSLASVSEGKLWGLSTGSDPYAYSSNTFTNSTLCPYGWVRMKQTAGTVAQLFYITDTDTVWNAQKSIAFSIIPDGLYHDYFVDFEDVNINGVITQVRLDPTTVNNSAMGIDFVRLTDSLDVGQASPSEDEPVGTKVVFTSLANEDGEIVESYWNSGVGGTVSSGGSTFRVGDDSSNRGIRTILSFDTSSIPDDATVYQVSLGITRTGQVGDIPIAVSDPWTGYMQVDVAAGSFNNNSALQNIDWQVAATAQGASQFAWPAFKDGMTLYSRLEDHHLQLINKTGRTQFRIRYENDDDGDYVADYTSYATANHSNASYRPVLIVHYGYPEPEAPDYLLDTSFESSEGWSAQATWPTAGWTQTMNDGSEWSGSLGNAAETFWVYTAAGGNGSPGRVINRAQGSYLLSPTVHKPGKLSFAINRSGSNAVWTLEVQKSVSGGAWEAVGSVSSSDVAIYPDYSNVTLNVNDPSNNVQLRWIFTSRTAGNCSIDDIKLKRYTAAGNLVETGFEDLQGWSGTATWPIGNWSQTLSSGKTWQATAGSGSESVWPYTLSGGDDSPGRVIIRAQGAALVSPAMNQPGRVTFAVNRSSSTANWVLDLQKSANGGAWATVGSVYSSTVADYPAYSHVEMDVREWSDNVTLRWILTSRSAGNCSIDNVGVDVYQEKPLLFGTSFESGEGWSGMSTWPTSSWSQTLGNGMTWSGNLGSAGETFWVYTSSGGNGSSGRILNRSVGDYLVSPAVNAPGRLTFWVNRSGTDADWVMNVEKSTDGVNWSVIGTVNAVQAPVAPYYAPIEMNVDELSSNVQLRWRFTSRTMGNCSIDDVYLESR